MAKPCTCSTKDGVRIDKDGLPNDLTCPACKHTGDKDTDFFHATGEVYKYLMVKTPKKKKGILSIFKQGPFKQLYACSNCGIAFIEVDK